MWYGVFMFAIFVASFMCAIAGATGTEPGKFRPWLGLIAWALLLGLLLTYESSVRTELKNRLVADKKIQYVCDDSTGAVKLRLVDYSMQATWPWVRYK